MRRDVLEPLFDAHFYAQEAGLAGQEDALAHYIAHGEAAGLKPNPIFDPIWYGERHAGGLLHYALEGEAAGDDPSPFFDVAWYRKTYAVERPLAHYLAHRFGDFSPCPEFDAAFYRKTYPDVAKAGIDPFQHYMHFGYREFRKPRAGLNPRLFKGNPVAYQRAHPESLPPTPGHSVYDEVKRFTRRGAQFEDLAPPLTAEAQVLALAFYLPQFHRVAENEAWWGEGYTEWTQLAKGQPRFAGHYQPRIPGMLGFYDLTNVAVLRQQAKMAQDAGIGAFVFYYYDFNGHRLLEKPLELWLATSDIALPFCLMWANENWTRRWDGLEEDILIAQDYEGNDIAGFLRYFRDPRYVRLQGRPLLMIYRASLIPDTQATLARWRHIFAQEGEEPLFIMAQTFEDRDPRALGFDGAIEFPPHKLTRGLSQVFDTLDIFDERFEADVFAYEDLVAASLREPVAEYPLIKTALPSWDNDARRQGQGLTVIGSTPEAYERWLGALITRARPFYGQRMIAINAWNEWSEGAYLEPDVYFGAAYLNATRRALRGPLATAKISAFITYEGGEFPLSRLRSLFAQTAPLHEIAVLDKGEDCLAIVEAEAHVAQRDLMYISDVGDFGRQAAKTATGDFVYIAEADGVCDPFLLSRLVEALLQDPQAVFASLPEDSGALWRRVGLLEVAHGRNRS